MQKSLREEYQFGGTSLQPVDTEASLFFSLRILPMHISSLLDLDENPQCGTCILPLPGKAIDGLVTQES